MSRKERVSWSPTSMRSRKRLLISSSNRLIMIRMHWIRKTPILKSSSMLLIGETRRCLAVLIAVKRRLFLIY
ncbi:hypothetical protein [Butyrivibrio sp. WCD3002]|uniref:hypothetical protein n=1 Tax=Butyrivibrio sp. WCD3002 TaxID=1280676 RepID=UPI0012DFDB9D|nr:hypothetical protein [Butyrivibrio sp. WCD3002]